jgi:hypothetical protein
MYKYIIIGSGVTGLLLLLVLATKGSIEPNTICVIDPYFDGGDMMRKWGSVQSNTPWSKTFLSIQKISPTITSSLPQTSTTPLHEIPNFLRSCTSALQKQSRQIQGLATKAHYNSSTKQWTVHYSLGSAKGSVEGSRLILAQGSEPRGMDLPIPSIPLEIALDSCRIKQYVRPKDHVLVFGTMHSGSLILKNVMDCSGATATGFYKKEKAFYFARDGEYDGIKEDSAVIAHEILSGKYGDRLSLVNVNTLSDVIRNTIRAKWVVYAMGFSPRKTIQLQIDDSVARTPEQYDGTTGRLEGAPNAWGFGIAYPNRAPDGVHWDVGVASFVDHILLQLNDLINGI